MMILISFLRKTLKNKCWWIRWINTLIKGGNDIQHKSYEDQIKFNEDGRVDTYVPFRNGLLLSIATAYADSLFPNEKVKIYYGAHSDDNVGSAYADCSPEFSEAMEELERLREFKAEYDRKIALQELNDKMDTILVNFNVSEDLVKELKEKVVNGEYSLEKFELELFRNNTPMKKEYKKEEKQTKLPIVDSEEKMSEVDKLFARYNVPKRK